MGERHEPLLASVVEGVANILGDTDGGFTGSDIARLLDRCDIADIYPGDTKRHRLREALLARQHQDRASNAIVRFLVEAMAPVRYADDHALFEYRQDALNHVLVHAGLKIRDDGRVQHTTQAHTLSEATQLANRLRAELTRRGTHVEVLRFCSVTTATRPRS